MKIKTKRIKIEIGLKDLWPLITIIKAIIEAF